MYRSGRQADALECFQQARATLVEELGIEPGRELREVHQAILEQDLALPQRAVAETSSGLFVGRKREMAELVAGLDDAFAGRGGLFLLVGEPGDAERARELLAEAVASYRALGMESWAGAAARCAP